MDHGHAPEFGYFLIPEAADARGLLETARLADRLGYDLLAVQDHPYQPAHLDALALLGVILGQTERIRVFLDDWFGTFVLLGDSDPGLLRTFIEDVAPRVRERVAAARARAGAA